MNQSVGVQSESDVKDYKQTQSQRRVGFTQPSTLKMEEERRANIKERERDTRRSKMRSEIKLLGDTKRKKVGWRA